MSKDFDYEGLLPWPAQQQKDQEELERANLEFYKRWAPKMSPEDAEQLRLGMVPWYREENDKQLNIEMACAEF